MNIRNMVTTLSRYFEKKKKNLISLLNDSQLEGDLKPIKVGEKVSILELSETELKVRGTIDADAVSVNGASTATINDAVEGRLVTVGATTTELDAESGLTFNSNGTLTVTSDSAGTPQMKFVHDDSDDYFSIDVFANGVTTLKTNDDLLHAADIVIEADGAITLQSKAGTTEDIKLHATDDISLRTLGGRIGFVGPIIEECYIDFDTAATTTFGTALHHTLTLETAGTGDINLDSNGDIILDSADGNFIAKKAGTEFSAANSAYAGMILGYTRLEGDLTSQGTFELQDAITVEDDTHKVTFKTPPSEYVEIEASFCVNSLSTSILLTAGLSDQDASTGYQSIGVEYEYDYLGVNFSDGEADDSIHTVKWVLNADELTAIGSDNTFWIGLGTGGSTKTAYLTYGVRASHGIATPPFIIKATALPATIYEG